MQTIHQWDGDDCSCGGDTVICQGCGKIVCGSICVRRVNDQTHHNENIGPCCFWRYGFGHAGTIATGAR